MVSRTVRTGVAIVLVLLLGLVVVTPAASPMRLGYVTSDGMAPTLQKGDGYVAVPAGEVHPGEIVVYWSSVRGEYVTQRVVEETDRGFITKGDGNEATDQARGYPVVQRSDIVGEVAEIAGHPVVIPGVGRVVPFVQRYRPLVLAGMLLVVAALVIRERKRRLELPRSNRSLLRVRDVMYPLFAVLLLTLVAVTPMGADAYQLTYVATPGGEGPRTIPVDESVTKNVTVDVTRMPLTTIVVRATGATIREKRLNGSRLDLRLSLPPPGEGGPQRTTISVFPYPATLPRGVLERLHDVHPVVAILATTLVGVLPVYLLYRLLVDGSRPLAASRSRWYRWLRGE